MVTSALSTLSTSSTSSRSCDPQRLTGLLAGVVAGDDAAFNDLYALTSPRVARVVDRTLRSPDHSVEVVQEVFLHVWQHAAAFDPERGSVLGWLTMLAHRRAVDRVRQVSRSIERDHRASEEEEDRVPDVAELGLAWAVAADLRLAVDQLPALQRDAVLLTFFAGYTQLQAARVLRVPLGTLKSRVRTGVLSLRRHYGAVAA